MAPEPSIGPWSPIFLSDEELFQVIEDLPRRPFLAGQGKLRLSLAGAQTKLPVIVAGAHIGLPEAGQPTTHILKPSMPLYQGSTENEAFCMRLALAVGLEVAPVQARVLDIGGGKRRTYLVVDRYDRAMGLSGVRRLHQEDFCRLPGSPPPSNTRLTVAPDSRSASISCAGSRRSRPRTSGGC